MGVAEEHAPATTYVLVSGVMAVFISFGIVFSLSLHWYYFLIPVVLAIPVLVILGARWSKRQQAKRAIAGSLDRL